MPKYLAEPPDLRTQSGRLTWARLRAGWKSARRAAQDNGWNENTYRSREQGNRRAGALPEAEANTYGRAFQVSTAWLLTGKGPPDRNAREDEWDALTDEERATALRLLEAARRRA